MDYSSSLEEMLDKVKPEGVTAFNSIYEHLAVPTGAADTGSTDAVAAVRMGIPAIAIGRGRGGDNHTLSEWAEVQSTLVATKALLLLAVSMAEITPR